MTARVAPVPLPFFLEMVETLGRLSRAARQKAWLETPREARLVGLFFFAPWCEDSRAAGPLAARLHREGEPLGAALLGVSEYGAPEETEAYRREFGHRFPCVLESMSREGGEDPDLWHRRALVAIGDGREWGTPLFLFRAAGGATFACPGLPEEADLLRFLHLFSLAPEGFLGTK